VPLDTKPSSFGHTDAEWWKQQWQHTRTTQEAEQQALHLFAKQNSVSITRHNNGVLLLLLLLLLLFFEAQQEAQQ